jgi:phytoene desaturase
MPKKIAVIGSEIGGLAASCYLSKLGYDITVFEKNPTFGGKNNYLNLNGFEFDTGENSVIMLDILKEILDFCGYEIDKVLPSYNINVLCKYFFNDQTEINFYKDINLLSQEIAFKTQDSESSVHSFFNYSKEIQNLTTDIYLNQDFDWKLVFEISFWKSCLQFWKLDLFRTMFEGINSFFKDYRTQQIFLKNGFDFGSNPYLATATFNSLASIKQDGLWLPKNGISEIPKVLFKIAKKQGVQFVFNTGCREIEKLKNSKYNLLLESENKVYKTEDFDYIIYNGDYFQTQKQFNKLLIFEQNPYLPENLTTKDFSSSAIIFYWGIEGIYPKLDLCNVIFSNNSYQEFTDIFERQIVPNDPTIYINITSKFIPKTAPKNCENWSVMINTPPNLGQNWDLEVLKIKKKVLDKIKQVLNIDLEHKILVEKIVTPLDFQKQNSSFIGNFYGLNLNKKETILKKPKSQLLDFKNLYFVNANSNVISNIPLSILYAKKIAEKISKQDIS